MCMDKEMSNHKSVSKAVKREVELSDRLKALADMVTPGSRVCDVGCDHGYLSIYLVQKGISPGVIAMDVRTGPLSRCTEHVMQYGLEQYIEQRLSDGLEALHPKEADTMVCAGMGGRLMQSILMRRQEVARSFKELVLQPQSELMAFREFLRSQGYRIVEENMIEEEGKFYPMMKVIPGGTPLSCEDPLYDRFGELLLKESNPVLFRFLEYRKRVLWDIRKNMEDAGAGSLESTGKQKKRLLEIEEELTDIERAFTFYK